MEKTKTFLLWVSMMLTWLAALMLTLKWAGVTLETKQVFALYCLMMAFRFRSAKVANEDKYAENIISTVLWLAVAEITMKFA